MGAEGGPGWEPTLARVRLHPAIQDREHGLPGRHARPFRREDTSLDAVHLCTSGSLAMRLPPAQLAPLGSGDILCVEHLTEPARRAGNLGRPPK
jgi:hypothetical protein